MEKLRTHHCGQLNASHVGQDVVLMGWVHSLRNLGSLVFIDLRDHFGLTQIFVPQDAAFFEQCSKLRPESVIQIKGKVEKRKSAINSKLATGEIEILATGFSLESPSEILPFPIAHNPKQESDDTRLKYRFLDLRTEKMHRNISFRFGVIRFIRETLYKMGFQEFQTPILTSSSPEGARDFLVPSRLHPGKFYALPQAPQQFKQLLMCSGFDKYFQIAPCFRDEDPRADRAPGEFYQLDMEMSFVTQDDVFDVIEGLMKSLFENEDFTKNKIKPVSQYANYYQKNNRFFPCIPWKDAMEKYGSDKPDLRFGLEMQDVKNIFAKSEFKPFVDARAEGVISCLVVPGAAQKSRKFFDELDIAAKENGLGGLPWFTLKDSEWKGPMAKLLSEEEKSKLSEELKLKNDDGCLFITHSNKLKGLNAGGKLRLMLGDQLNLKEKDVWAFAWIVDFPMYEWNDEFHKVDFSHNPFSMPQGGLKSLENLHPLDVLAHQYDIVCNGVEIASGAIRNHRREVMKKAFEIAGYSEDVVEKKFGALWNAFAYGPPPHGGIAPGIDRMIMLLLNEPNIREVIAFPLNQKACDLLMQAPSDVTIDQLNEIHIQIKNSQTK